MIKTYIKAKLLNKTVEQTHMNACRVSELNKQNINSKVYLIKIVYKFDYRGPLLTKTVTLCPRKHFYKKSD